jgi:hypothetical protein
MLREITWRQFLEWQAFFVLEPFDEDRADIRIASVVQALLNINRDRKKRKKPYTLEDARVWFGDTPRPKREAQTWQQMLAVTKMYAAAEQSRMKRLAKIEERKQRKHGNQN